MFSAGSQSRFAHTPSHGPVLTAVIVACFALFVRCVPWLLETWRTVWMPMHMRHPMTLWLIEHRCILSIITVLTMLVGGIIRGLQLRDQVASPTFPQRGIMSKGHDIDLNLVSLRTKRGTDNDMFCKSVWHLAQLAYSESVVHEWHGEEYMSTDVVIKKGVFEATLSTDKSTLTLCGPDGPKMLSTVEMIRRHRMRFLTPSPLEHLEHATPRGGNAPATDTFASRCSKVKAKDFMSNYPDARQFFDLPSPSRAATSP